MHEQCPALSLQEREKEGEKGDKVARMRNGGQLGDGQPVPTVHTGHSPSQVAARWWSHHQGKHHQFSNSLALQLARFLKQLFKTYLSRLNQPEFCPEE